MPDDSVPPEIGNVIMMKDIEHFPDFVRKLPKIVLPLPGSRGWLMQGAQQQVVFVEFEESVEMPEHTHSEQWEFPLAGKVVLHMGGESKDLRAGDNFYIPADVPHGATVHAGYKAMIVFNSVDRYKLKE